MADATELQSSGVTRLIDSAENIVADMRVRADGKASLCIDDEVITLGVNATITVGTSPVEAKAGAIRLADRRALSIMPMGAPVWYGFNSNVTTATGRKLFNQQALDISIGDCPLYLIAEGNTSVSVWEAK